MSEIGYLVILQHGNTVLEMVGTEPSFGLAPIAMQPRSQVPARTVRVTTTIRKPALNPAVDAFIPLSRRTNHGGPQLNESALLRSGSADEARTAASQASRATLNARSVSQGNSASRGLDNGGSIRNEPSSISTSSLP